MWTQLLLTTTLRDIDGVTNIHYYETLGSSNTVAKALAQQGAPHGTVIIADEQTAGRGRQGRTWQTPAGTAIACSLLLRPTASSFNPAHYSLLGGLAVADAINATISGLDVKVKWPNDVWVNGFKVSGVLAEAGWAGNTLDYVVLGIGINVNGSAEQLGATRTPSATLEHITGHTVDRLAVLNALVTGCFNYLETPVTNVIAAVNQQLLWQGATVTLTQAETEVASGTLACVTATGAVQITTPTGGVDQYMSGELRG